MEPPQIDSYTLAHRRTHNLILASRLLNQRDHPSPFTLVLDSLNQSSAPIVQEYISRALSAKIHVIFVSFETPKKPPGVDSFISGRRKPPTRILDDILKVNQELIKPGSKEKCLVILDTLHPIIYALGKSKDQNKTHLSSFLGSLLSPSTTLLATYHMDVPITFMETAFGSFGSFGSLQANAYSPAPLVLLNYLATTLITVHSPDQTFACKSAIDRSQPTPKFGMAEGKEGILAGIGSNSKHVEPNNTVKLGASDGVVFELEHRRKSGRGMSEWFFLPSSAQFGAFMKLAQHIPKERIVLLEDHPRYRPVELNLDEKSASLDDAEDVMETTFSLGLTDRQKAARDEVVLPYFDAQKEGGGMGGRILYTPGREDDWDEEEDEI